MSAVKLYVVMHGLFVIALVAGITACAIYFNKYSLMWWYLLPALFAGLEVETSKDENEEK